MYEKDKRIVELPHIKGVAPELGYTKLQSEQLRGRQYVSIGSNGIQIGQITGTYAYRHRGKRTNYGLNTEYKFSDGWAVRTGTLRRCELEQGNSTLIPKGELANQISELLRTTEKPSRELLAGVQAEVYAAQEQRRGHSQGLSV